jgi:amidohydrolase
MLKKLTISAVLLSVFMSQSTFAIDEVLAAKVIDWRRHLHQNPELSNREFRTASFVENHLRALGLEVKTNIAHTGITALLKGGQAGPLVALRADMDALPVSEQVDLPFASKVTSTYRGQTVGVMHACGHDTHVAILMGVAEALASQKENLKGDVLFIFQPAEEGAPEGEEGGAQLMLKEGIFKDRKPDAIFGLHITSTIPAGFAALKPGPLMASEDSFEITLKGRQTHGSRPWNGVDPIVTAAQLINATQTIVSRQVDITTAPAVVSFGAIKGGVRSNIIPDEVELIGTIRSFDQDMRADIKQRLAHTTEMVAATNGAESHIHIDHGYPVTVNSKELTAQMTPSLEKVFGKNRVLLSPLVTGAEDFSYYALEVPGMFFFLGGTEPGVDPNTAPSNHSPLFKIDESALRLGVDALIGLTKDYMM